MGGTIAGQAIVVLSSPLLTRLYTPEHIGIFAAFSSVLAILGSIATLRYELAIPLPDTEEDAAAVAGVALVSSLVLGLITWAGVSRFGEAISRFLNVPALHPYLWLLPIGVSLTGIYQVGYYCATRSKDFIAIARTKLMQSLGMVVIHLLGYGFGPIALLVGRVVGQSSGTLYLWKRAWQRSGAALQRADVSRLKWAARRYVRFPLLSTWVSGLNTVGMQLPPLLFAGLFGPAAAGVYMVTHRVLAMPMTLIGKAISDVFFAQAADDVRIGRLGQLVARLHGLLCQIALPPSLMLVVAGPDIFAMALGESWRQAGEFAQWMAPWTFVVFVASPLSSVLVVMERQGQNVLFEIILLSVRVASLAFGGVLRSLEVAIALFSLSSATCWLGLLVWLLRVSGADLASVIRTSTSALIWAVVSVAPLWLVQFVLPGRNWGYVGLIGTLLLIAMRYLALLRRMSS